ncbi:hypothetical protein NDU88_003277 [Pleurodeles waltl]|uniref:Uncharacterized protein n=1 Tax=Pleurodeles waltl TaxID=8319 RepID=A0AAV7RCF1_PLEWA|nr:hypothetical protein NDU88_003277 [Pleurodeles waltl]
MTNDVSSKVHKELVALKRDPVTVARYQLSEILRRTYQFDVQGVYPCLPLPSVPAEEDKEHTDPMIEDLIASSPPYGSIINTAAGQDATMGEKPTELSEAEVA